MEKPNEISKEDWEELDSPPLTDEVLSRMRPVNEQHPHIPERVRSTAMIDRKTLLKLKSLLEPYELVRFAFIFGSQVTNSSEKPNDWDFAVFWDPDLPFWEKLGWIEDLRRHLAGSLGVGPDSVDLVDLNQAGLSISSSVVEHGIPIKGEGTPDVERFYYRIWALEEEFYWRLTVENRAISG